MGNSSTKIAELPSRVARLTSKVGLPRSKPPPKTSYLPVEDDLLANFKPTKVVDMSRPDAAKMANRQVPEMDPDILRQAIKLGPAIKLELTHQKIFPDDSELVKSKTPRPLPKDRTRVPARTDEMAATKGLLTQTQLIALLKRGGASPESIKDLAGEFHISEDTVPVLLRYYRAPDVRLTGDTMTVRWHWPLDAKAEFRQ